MKNKKIIIALFLILSLTVNQAFAYENSNEIQEKIKSALGESEVKALIKEEVKKQVKEEVKKINSVKEENSLLVNEEKKVVKKTLEDVFFDRIKNSKNEEERVSILKEYKKNIEKPEFINEKIKNIFSKFDFILYKLNSVNKNIKNEYILLKEKGLDLNILSEKNILVDSYLSEANNFKSSAWIKMEAIDYFSEKENISESLKEVKKDLISSKTKIKEASQLLKENISFIRGALTILKK